MADIGRTLGEAAAQAQDMEFFDAIGDMPRDFYFDADGDTLKDLYINTSRIATLERIAEGGESVVVDKGSWLGCQVAIKCYKRS